MIGRLRPYLTLLQKKASGELPTTAQWIRNYVRTHPDYSGMFLPLSVSLSPFIIISFADSEFCSRPTAFSIVFRRRRLDSAYLLHFTHMRAYTNVHTKALITRTHLIKFSHTTQHRRWNSARQRGK